MKNKVILFIGPSGSGKTTLINILINQYPDIFHKIVTSTSRLPRHNEREGVDYHFLNPVDFQNTSKFLEQTHYAGNSYGITYNEVNSKLKQKHTLAAVDINGLHHFVEYLGKENVISFFVYAPINVLRNRMFSRGDSKEKVIQRLTNIIQTREFNNQNLCDCTLLNDESIQISLAQAVDYLKKNRIIKS